MIGYKISERLSRYIYFNNTSYDSIDKIIKTMFTRALLYDSNYILSYNDIELYDYFTNEKIDNTECVNKINKLIKIFNDIKNYNINVNYDLRKSIASFDIDKYKYIILVGDIRTSHIPNWPDHLVINSSISDNFANAIRTYGIKRNTYTRNNGIFYIKDEKILSKINMVYKGTIYIIKIDHDDDN